MIHMLERLGKSRPQAATAARAARQEAHRLEDLFTQVFGVEPDPANRETLARLAGSADSLTEAQKLRRILAAIDQQVFKTGFSVRWDAGDLMRTTLGDLVLLLDRADVSVSHPIAAGNYEGHLISFFRSFLKPGMTVVDAGANVGLYSVLAARLVGSTGRVISFEPNSENCRLLLASAAENGLDNVELHPLALGQSRGYTHFTSALGSNGGILEGAKNDLLHPSCKIVPVARLDDFELTELHLLKMDVEGAEAMVLDGAEGTIDRCRPVIAMEFSHEMLNRISRVFGGEFLQRFTRKGYAVNVLDKVAHELRPVDDVLAFDREFHGTGRLEDLVLVPG